MRLEKVELHGFRSIPDKLGVHVLPNLTCFVGANEHGKTNILDAINLLDAGAFDPHDRHVHSNDETHPKLSFLLRLSTAERDTLIVALEAELAIWTAKSDSDEDRAKSIKSFERAIERMSRKDFPQLGVELRARGSRYLVIAGTYYYIPAVTPSGGKTALREWFGETVPAVVLFEPDDELVDHITLADLKAHKNAPFEGLLRLAGAWDDMDSLFTSDTKAHRALTYAGRKLTRKIRRVWSQGAAHKFAFHESGGVLHLTIEDPTTFDTPSRRSLGFRSFFSFYLSIYNRTEAIDPEGFILLFDEPGIHLHPQGQKDLVKELRRLSHNNQVLYTTHSPFMLDRNDLGSTLLVRKGATGAGKGTHVVTRPYGENWAPLNAALGISPADTFFPADTVLLVEGRSDRLYLSRYMQLCQQQTRADLNYLTVIDCERRDEIGDYLRMLLASNRSVVVLADGDQGGEDLGKLLSKIAGSKRDRLSFIDLRSILNATKEVSVEDALPLDSWMAAVTKYVSEIHRNDKKLDRDELAGRAAHVSLGRATADYLVDLGVLASHKKFSKTTVADFYCKLPLTTPIETDPLARICKLVSDKLGLAN